jgi:orotidine-5'-phosphate decarboxylase
MTDVKLHDIPSTMENSIAKGRRGANIVTSTAPPTSAQEQRPADVPHGVTP